MAFEDFVVVLDRLQSAFEVGSVSLHRDGEPLLNKRLPEFVAELTRRGIWSTFSSNCTLIDAERAAALVQAGLGGAKTDFCADADRFEELRAGASWPDALAGMRALLAAAGPDFVLNVTDLGAHGVTGDEAERAVAATRALFDRDDRVHVRPARLHNALGASREAPAEGRGGYVLCHQPWVNLTVDFAGRVVACCRDLRSEYVLGNLLEQPAADVWNGEPARALRRALAKRRPQDIPVCARCDAPWTGSYPGRSRGAKLLNRALDPMWGHKRS